MAEQVGLLFKQSTFDLKAKDKYNKLLNSEMEVLYIFMTKNYDISDCERVPLTMKWLGHEGLYSVQTLTNEGQETCKRSMSLFSILNAKFEQQHNETTLLLQYFNRTEAK